MSEELTNYLKGAGFKVAFLHNEIKTLERLEIVRDLRLGKYDVVVTNGLPIYLDIEEYDNVAGGIEKYNKETGVINEVSKMFNLSFVEAGNKRDNDTILDAIDYLMSVGEGSNLNDDVDVIARIRDFYYLEDEYDIDILFYQLGL